MRLWMQRNCLAWFIALGASILPGCGGSSSETPEPVRPDSWQLKLRHQRQLSVAAEAAIEPARLLTGDKDLGRATPARDTWGAQREPPLTATALPNPAMDARDQPAPVEDTSTTPPANKATPPAHHEPVPPTR